MEVLLTCKKVDPKHDIFFSMEENFPSRVKT